MIAGRAERSREVLVSTLMTPLPVDRRKKFRPQQLQHPQQIARGAVPGHVDAGSDLLVITSAPLRTSRLMVSLTASSLPGTVREL